jgi:polyisoprenyl-phosphate glycosyltransferase
LSGTYNRILTMNSQSLALVIPIFNEEDAIPLLQEELFHLAEQLPPKTDLIFVDDGSTDRSLQLLKTLDVPFSKKVVQLSRNFGHQSALLAGMAESKADITLTLDADLQHPLSLIPKMLFEHKSGVDVVLTKRTDGQVTGAVKKQSAQLFYWLMNAVSEHKIEINSSDFRSLNRKALDALLHMPEKRKFLRGMVQWIGFRTVILPYEVQQRSEGESKYTWSKMMKLALHGITSFSTAPLYLSAFFGVFLFLMAVIYALYVLYVRFFTGELVQGWASAVFVQLVIGGFLSLFLGVIGIYIAAIYDEVKNRPVFIVKDTYEDPKG